MAQHGRGNFSETRMRRGVRVRFRCIDATTRNTERNISLHVPKYCQKLHPLNGSGALAVVFDEVEQDPSRAKVADGVAVDRSGEVVSIAR